MAYGEMVPPPGTQADLWEQTNTILQDLSLGIQNIAQVATDSVWGNVSWDRVKSWIRDGTASKYLKVGDQLNIPYTYDEKEYNWTFDVWHHFDGSDDNHPKVTYKGDDGTDVTGNGMVIGAHYCSPFAIPMNAHEAFFVPSVAMPKGTYNFTVDVNYVWGSGICKSIGETTYQFTTTKDVPSVNVTEYQFVWNADYTTGLSSLSIYSSWNSSSPVETCAVTVGSTGTSLGTISEVPATSSGHGYFNSIQRGCYASNNWEKCSGRSFLNSTDAVWHDSDSAGMFHRISTLEGKPGFLTGFNDSFVNSIVQRKNVTVPHPIDTNNTYGTSTTYDRCWTVSAREHNFANYLSNTSEGYQAEGVVLDYWKNLAQYNDRSQWAGWTTYGELRTYGLENVNASQYVFLRSAARSAGGSNSFGVVNSTGNVYCNNATYAYRAQPAFLIA